MFPGKKGSFHEKRKGEGQTYFYRAKSPKNKEGEEGERHENKNKANKMANLLSSLQDEEQKKILGEDSEFEEDDDAKNVIERRQSVNRNNQLGMNL